MRKDIVVIVFLAVFVAAFVLAALGGTKQIEMADGALTGFFAVILGQCLTAIVAAFRTPDFFTEDPDSIARLKAKQRDAMDAAEARNADLAAKIEKLIATIEYLKRPPTLADLRQAEPFPSLVQAESAKKPAEQNARPTPPSGVGQL